MKYQVMPDLTPIEYEALKADIAENGILVPVEVDETGEVLDGHHRVKAWQELRADGIDLPDYARIKRVGWSEEEKRNHARKLNVLRRQLTEKQREKVYVDMRNDGMPYEEIAEVAGEDAKTVWNVINNSDLEISKSEIVNKRGQKRPAKYAKRKPKPVQDSMIYPGGSLLLDPVSAEKTVQEIREGRRQEIRQERIEKINKIAKSNAPLDLDQSYPIVYADPPWRYEHSATVSREIENQYPTMALEEICALPVSAIATPDAVLFLWTTSPKLAESLQVVEAWGFVYRTCMVWDKERIGMGYYARQQHELLLICTRGDLPSPEPENRPASVQRIRRDPEHSAKPQEFYALIESMYPEYDRIELFARNARDGWMAWGNQANDSRFQRETSVE